LKVANEVDNIMTINIIYIKH